MECPNCLKAVAEDAERCRCGYQFVGYVAPLTAREEGRDYPSPREVDRADGTAKGLFLLISGLMLTVVSFALSGGVGYTIVFTGLIAGGLIQMVHARR